MSKVFIVTGASKGLGVAIARYLLSQSHKVVVTARSKGPLDDISKAFPGQVEVVAGDITDAKVAQSLTKTAVSAFGKLDGMVICHGVLEPRRVADESMENFQHIYNVNVFSCLAVAQAGIPELRKSKGCIVWISSGAATGAYGAWSAYGSSKAAVNSIAAHVGVEEKDITSVAISPGKVDTDMQAVIRSKGKGTMDEAMHKSFVDEHASGDLLKPETSGNVVARFVADPNHELSGKSLRWDSPEMNKYQN